MACTCTCPCPGGICTPPPPPPGSRPPCYPNCPTPTAYTEIKPVGVDELIRRLAPSPTIPTTPGGTEVRVVWRQG